MPASQAPYQLLQPQPLHLLFVTHLLISKIRPLRYIRNGSYVFVVSWLPSILC